jgi:hypothetical protein
MGNDVSRSTKCRDRSPRCGDFERYTELLVSFPLSTPVLVAGSRASLLRVFVLYETHANVSLSAVHVFDGIDRVADLPVNSTARGGLSGRGGNAGDLVEGITAFSLPNPHSVAFGIGISIAFKFQQEDDITFFSAGCDFNI